MTVDPHILMNLDIDLIAAIHQVIEDTSMLTMTSEDIEEEIGDRKDIADFLIMAVSTFRDNNFQKTEVRRLVHATEGISVYLEVASDKKAYFEMVNLKDRVPDPLHPPKFIALHDGVDAATLYFSRKHDHPSSQDCMRMADV